MQRGVVVISSELCNCYTHIWARQGYVLEKTLMKPVPATLHRGNGIFSLKRWWQAVMKADSLQVLSAALGRKNELNFLSAYTFCYLFFSSFSEFPMVLFALDASSLLCNWKFSLPLTYLQLKNLWPLYKHLHHLLAERQRTYLENRHSKWMIPKCLANQYFYLHWQIKLCCVYCDFRGVFQGTTYTHTYTQRDRDRERLTYWLVIRLTKKVRFYI